MKILNQTNQSDCGGNERKGNRMRHLLGKTLGNYQLTRILGQGRMGIVYLANDKALLRPTALKLMAWSMENESEQDPVKWFLSEARSVARISHPNVIQIYNIARHDKYRYIAMEYIDGESAERTLERDGRFTVSRATDILIQTCDALDAAHQAGVIHRDIKPANLLLRKDGVAKLSDFGMAMSSYTNTGFSATSRVGTPFFNAPETWAGRPASPASDIYALGVTYFLLLTGKLPFSAKNMDELRQAHLSQPALDPRVHVPDLPALCNAITSKCLSKNEYQRVASARELGNIARELYEQLSGTRGKSTVSTMPMLGTSGRIPRSEYKVATGHWLEHLHFSIEPFGPVNPLSCPFVDRPFSQTMEFLSSYISSREKIIVLHGEAGSGKSTLLQRYALQAAEEFSVIYLHRNHSNPFFSIVEELCKVFAIHPSKDTVLDELEKWLNEDTSEKNRHMLLFLDDIVDSGRDIEELSLLFQLVQRIEHCSLVVSTETPKLNAIQQIKVLEEHKEIELPSLSNKAVIEYIQRWMQIARAPGAPLLLVSTDAALWIAHKSQGNPARINRHIRRVLRQTDLNGRSVISTWEAWYCGQQLERGNPLPDAVPECIANWPTPEILDVLNEYRQSVGIGLLMTAVRNSTGDGPMKQEGESK